MHTFIKFMRIIYPPIPRSIIPKSNNFFILEKI